MLRSGVPRRVQNLILLYVFFLFPFPSPFRFLLRKPSSGLGLSRHADFILTISFTPQTEKARAELAKAEGKIDQYRKDASATALKKIDEADRKVEDGAAKAKSGISSWFGGK